jgi:Saxitoxin biosynthesis operon protein SxtJ
MTSLAPWRGPLPMPKDGWPPPPKAALWRRILTPVYRAWMKLAHLLAWINTRILLGVVYLVVLTPIRLALSIARRDPLQRRLDRKRPSYWTERTPAERSRPADDYTNQY